jgi:2-polyprenyl-3-methyl-5-hydroxy-6-metoxy-1,4-benzoquinol methylase
MVAEHGFQKAMDLGCGPATKAGALMNAGIRALVLIDQPNSEDMVRAASPNAKFIGLDLETAEPKAVTTDISEQFDLIVCADVIEHLANPFPCLDLVLHALKPSGVAIFSTPDRDVLRGKHCMTSPNPAHVREWAHAEFAALLRSRGFTIRQHRRLPQHRLHPVEEAARIVLHSFVRLPRWRACQVVVCGRKKHMNNHMPTAQRFVNPATQHPLIRDGAVLIDSVTRVQVASLHGDIPRFVSQEENYAESFGWQWKHWADNLSETRGAKIRHRQILLDRTHFLDYDLHGKTLLECGMGGGDDTEVLLSLPFGEIHSFDLSTAVERAARHLRDERLVLSQASIYAIPYLDQSFDFVFCHRVLQHTPDPEKSLRAICKKVKPNGILFIHSYKRSPEYMSEWRYKYRWLTKRVPKVLVYSYVRLLGWPLHHVVGLLRRLGPKPRSFAFRYIPFYRIEQSGYCSDMGKAEAIELGRMVTFDALTPKYDSPMTTQDLQRILGEEGFTIEHLEDSMVSPVYATARRNA